MKISSTMAFNEKFTIHVFMFSRATSSRKQIATEVWSMGAPIPWTTEGSIAATVIHDTVYACGKFLCVGMFLVLEHIKNTVAAINYSMHAKWVDHVCYGRVSVYTRRVNVYKRLVFMSTRRVSVYKRFVYV